MATPPKKKPKKIKHSQHFNELLLRVTNELVTSQSLSEALETLINITISAIGAERGTIFLNDSKTGELYSRIIQGNFNREIRIMNTSGVAGWVFTNNKGVLINDAYTDERFNPAIDKKTGLKTNSIISVPLRTMNGEIMGVTQILNKVHGDFTSQDLELLEAMTQQAAFALQRNLDIEKMESARKKEMEFLDIVSSISSELNLGPLLQKIISTITRMLDAERSTLFINDEKTNELFTEIGEGLGAKKIRFPNHLGIAGAVFTSGKTINLPYAYADLRFNPAFDRTTGFFTRSVLCCPVRNKSGQMIGVTQVLNKKGGAFTAEDESRLAAFTSQISMGIENAKLFSDVQNMKNYNESMLESMSNGVITLAPDGKVVTCNAAGLKILGFKNLSDVINLDIKDLLSGSNEFILDKFHTVQVSGVEDELLDAELNLNDAITSLNLYIVPHFGINKERMGIIVIMEDISSEKRMKSTMSRYMDPALADKLMAGGEGLLGGISSIGTVLFSDIREFTTLTEDLGAQGTVSFLNEYFTIMVECIQNEEGMLDKFIGDAIMAVFGTPFPHADDPDRAVHAAINMMKELNVYNEKRIAKGLKPVDHGMGINTDHIVSGNIGSPKRMDYTVIGDGVNLASRIESLCKVYGAHILISEFCFKQLKGTYRAREVDRVIVKGKTEAVGIYEILDYHTDETFPQMIDCLGYFNDGYRLYQKGEFEKALKQFNQAIAIYPEDKCSKMYAERCELLIKTPPTGVWEGIWVMKTK